MSEAVKTFAIAKFYESCGLVFLVSALLIVLAVAVFIRRNQ